MKKIICLSLVMAMSLFSVACATKTHDHQHDHKESVSVASEKEENHKEHEDHEHKMSESAKEAHFEYAAQYTLEKDKVYTLKAGHTHEHSLVFSFEPQNEKFDSHEGHEALEAASAKGELMVEDQEEVALELSKAYRLSLKHMETNLKFTVSETGVYWFVANYEPGDELFFAVYDDQGKEVSAEKEVEHGDHH